MRTAKAVGMEMLFEPGHTGVAIKQSQNWKIHVHQYTKFALLVLLSQRIFLGGRRPPNSHKPIDFASARPWRPCACSAILNDKKCRVCPLAFLLHPRSSS